jgi:hypothetical protein
MAHEALYRGLVLNAYQPSASMHGLTQHLHTICHDRVTNFAYRRSPYVHEVLGAAFAIWSSYQTNLRLESALHLHHAPHIEQAGHAEALQLAILQLESQPISSTHYNIWQPRFVLPKRPNIHHIFNITAYIEAGKHGQKLEYSHGINRLSVSYSLHKPSPLLQRI